MPATQAAVDDPERVAADASGLLSLAEALLDTWRDMAAVRLAVLACELRDAGLSIAAMIGMAVAAACLAAATWLMLLGLALHWAVRSGVHWDVAALALLVTNLVASVLLVSFVRRTGSGLLSRTIANLRATRGGE